MTTEPKTKRGNIWLGFGLSALCNLMILPGLAMLILPFSESVAIAMVMGIGLSQLVYVIPLIFIFRRQRKIATMQGMLAGAGITFLLNGGCWGLCLGMM